MHERRQPADFRQPYDGHQQTTNHHHDELNKIRPRHRTQPAVDGIAASQQRERDDGDGFVDVEHAAHRLGAGEHHDRHLRDDPQHEAAHGEEVAAMRVVTALQKFRHRVKPAPDVEGQKNPDQHGKGNDVPPLPLRDDEAHGVGDAHHADEMFRADVRRDDRAADRVPRQPFAREEVVPGIRGLPARHPKAQHDREQQVDSEENKVQRLHNSGDRHVGSNETFRADANRPSPIYNKQGVSETGIKSNPCGGVCRG